jgi:hypothetical protein
MRKLIFAGLALSAVVIASSPRPAAAQIKEWCTIESSSTRQCYWDTWDQCRQSKMHLMGGSCFRNPAFAGHVSAGGDPGFREVPNIFAPSPYVPVQEAYRPGRPVHRHRRDSAR